MIISMANYNQPRIFTIISTSPPSLPQTKISFAPAKRHQESKNNGEVGLSFGSIPSFSSRSSPRQDRAGPVGPRSCGHRQFRHSGRTRARRAAWPLRQGRLRLGFPRQAKVSGYPGTSWRVLPGVRGRAVVACNAVHKAGRWAGSRTALEYWYRTAPEILRRVRGPSD